MLRKISHQEAQYYIPLNTNDPYTATRAVAFTLILEADGGHRVTYYGESIFDPSGAIKKPEWVYVLVNKDIPGICKIGMTTTSVEQRVREINSATGVISPWFPVFRYKCVNSYYLEQDIHHHLQDLGYRVSKNREGFAVSSQIAIEVIQKLGQRYQTHLTATQPFSATGDQEISFDNSSSLDSDYDSENQGI